MINAVIVSEAKHSRIPELNGYGTKEPGGDRK